MQTLQFSHRLALDDLEVRERPVPSPGPHEVLVQVHAVSLNYRDLAIARGAYGSYPMPLVPGSDAAGVIAARGSEARRFAVGDRVCIAYVLDWVAGPLQADVTERRLGGPVPGVFAEYVCVDERALVRAPAHLSFVEAATLPVAGVTAWQALVEDGELHAGSLVGVSGTGGVSLFTVQLARASGARVVLVGRNGDKLARARALGAETVDASTEPAWERRVLELTGGAGVDAFVDIVGGTWLARSIAATRVGGTVHLLGFVGGRAAAVDLVEAIRRAVTLRATSGGSRMSFERLVRALELGAIHPVIDRVFGFSTEEARAAYGHLAEGQPFGKVVIAIGGAA